MNKVILFCPAGREEVLAIQLRYIKSILDLEIVNEYHIWDFSWTENDSNYISKLACVHPKIKIKRSPYNNACRSGDVASKQFSYFLSTYYNYLAFKDFVFVKLDDDIVFIDTRNFENFIQGRMRSNSFLYSANVINNKHTEISNFDNIHTNFIQHYQQILETNRQKETKLFSKDLRLSINFVSFLGKDLQYINKEFSNGIGSNDEWRLCNVIPTALLLDNEICSFMTVVHYAFGGCIDKKYLQDYIKIHDEYTDSPSLLP